MKISVIFIIRRKNLQIICHRLLQGIVSNAVKVKAMHRKGRVQKNSNRMLLGK